MPETTRFLLSPRRGLMQLRSLSQHPMGVSSDRRWHFTVAWLCSWCLLLGFTVIRQPPATGDERTLLSFSSLQPQVLSEMEMLH